MIEHYRPRTFILSACLAGLSDEDNTRRDAELACDLALIGFPFTSAAGRFKGVDEACYVVAGSAAQSEVASLAKEYGQKNYLAIAERDRIAYFVDPRTNYHTHAGKFTSIGITPPSDGDYTYCNGHAYVIAPRVGVDLPGGF